MVTLPARRVLVHLATAAALFVLVPLGLVWAVPSLSDPLAIRAWILGFGRLAPLVFVVVQAAQVLVAPVPGQVLAVAGGYLFGPLYGALYSLAGMTLGSTVAFLLSRRFGRPYVLGLVGADRLSRFDEFVDRTGLAGLFVLFLLPGMPDDVVCFTAGVTEIPVRRLVVVSTLGRAPALLVASYLGAELAAGQLVVVGAAVVLLAAAWAVGYYHRRRLFALLQGRFGPPDG